MHDAARSAEIPRNFVHFAPKNAVIPRNFVQDAFKNFLLRSKVPRHCQHKIRTRSEGDTYLHNLRP